MYIYEAKNLDLGKGGIANGLIFKSTKDDAAQFVPAQVDDICGLIVPSHGDGEQLVCEAITDYQVSYAEEGSVPENEGLKIFAFQDEISGVTEGSDSASTVKGLIFKAVRGQEECSKEMTDEDIVAVLIEKGYNTETKEWETLDTPELVQMYALNGSKIMFDQSTYVSDGYTFDLLDGHCIFVPTYADIAWESSDETIATVENGLVTFLKTNENATITATIVGTDVSASCDVMQQGEH